MNGLRRLGAALIYEAARNRTLRYNGFMTTSNSIPNPLFVALGRLLEPVLNRLLRLDEESLKRITSLEGRAVALEFRDFNVAMRIQVIEGKLSIGPAFAGNSDLHVRASLGSLLALALKQNDDMMPLGGKIELSGDAELARRLEHVIKRFQPDIEEAFTRVFGDVIGYQIARTCQEALMWTKNTTKSLVQSTAEYLREESRDLVAPAEMEKFFDEVDELREKAQRLEKKLNQLRAILKVDSA